jgi:hypothetical protein
MRHLSKNIVFGEALIWMVVALLGISLVSCLRPPSENVANTEIQITLTWQDNSSDELGFKIERKIGQEGTYRQIATVGPNVTSYTDTGLRKGTTYYYRARAYNSSGYSPYSPEILFETPSH